jgi:hypothetical protein
LNALVEPLEGRRLLSAVVLAAVAAPSAPDLNSEFDSGVSRSDNLTSYDNSTPAKSLGFTVRGTTAGATVELIADGSRVIGTRVASGATTIIQTDGRTRLAEGAHDVVARLVSGGDQSPPSPATTLVIDVTAPPKPRNFHLDPASDSGVAHDDGDTNIKILTLRGTGVPGERVSVQYLGSGPLGAAVSPAGEWAVTLTAAEGWNHFYAQQVDAAGNASPAFDPQLDVKVDTEAPFVSGVYATGSGWPLEFVNSLWMFGLAGGPKGYALNAPNQGGVLPWVGVDRFWLLANEPLFYGPGDVGVRDDSGADLPADIQLSPPEAPNFLSNYGLSLSSPLAAGRYTLGVKGAPDGGVTDAAGNVLDGDGFPSEPPYRSGDGIPGGDFRLPVFVLPGDATRDGRVNALDLAAVKRRLGRDVSDTTTGPGSYSPFADITADARINALDLAVVKRNLGRAIAPVAPPPAAPAPAPQSGVAAGLEAPSSVTKELFASQQVLT